jgi:hypothetical protein
MILNAAHMQIVNALADHPYTSKKKRSKERGEKKRNLVVL